jgi:1,5-anhydro-D-fructose reductase (1,5-anhydro-D-mannitol-forming)
MQTIRWGILGVGDVTEVKSGPALQQAQGSALVAVMRRTGRLAEDYARRHRVPRWYDNAEALIADPEVDAVYIATPPGAHEELALAVARAGKPAYVEKPMARTHAECQRMVEAFASRGLPLFVAYYRRALPRFVKIKEVLDAGRIGRIASVSYRSFRPRHRGILLPWRLVPEQSGGGLFVDLGSHTLDLLDHLLGPLSDVTGNALRASSEQGNAEDVVTMRFRAAGALGVAVWNFAGHSREDWLEIIGTDGRVSCTIFGDEPIRVEERSGEETWVLPNPRHIQAPLIQSIVDELRGKGRCPSTGVSAARTSLVVDTVLSGYYGGREDGFWEYPGRFGK